MSPEFYQNAAGITKTLYDKAHKLASGDVDERRKKPKDCDVPLRLDSFERLFIVQFVLDWVEESGAEKMPMGDADGLSSLAALYGAADDLEALDNLSQIRLHDLELKPLYRLHTSKAAGYCEVLSPQVFSEVFHKDPRLAHIYLARKRGSFGICAKCANYKQILGSHHMDPDKRAQARREYRSHLDEQAYARQQYVYQATRGSVLPVGLDGKKVIEGSLSICMDKMTATTAM